MYVFQIKYLPDRYAAGVIGVHVDNEASYRSCCQSSTRQVWLPVSWASDNKLVGMYAVQYLNSGKKKHLPLLFVYTIFWTIIIQTVLLLGNFKQLCLPQYPNFGSKAFTCDLCL